MTWTITLCDFDRYQYINGRPDSCFYGFLSTSSRLFKLTACDWQRGVLQLYGFINTHQDSRKVSSAATSRRIIKTIRKNLACNFRRHSKCTFRANRSIIMSLFISGILSSVAFQPQTGYSILNNTFLSLTIHSTSNLV